MTRDHHCCERQTSMERVWWLSKWGALPTSGSTLHWPPLNFMFMFVFSKLDHWNALLFGLPNCTTKRLQHIQNATACLITLTTKHDNMTPILFNIHWLAVNHHTIFGILLITQKALSKLAQSYIHTYMKWLHPTIHYLNYIHYPGIF